MELALPSGSRDQPHRFSHSSWRWGLPATPHGQRFPVSTKRSSIAESLVERLHELDFEVDGLVLKVNRFDQREQLGATSKSPAG